MGYYNDENYKYEMPKEIKDKFTKEMLLDFIEDFIDIFDCKGEVTYYEDMAYSEGTIGWHNAFTRMCRKYELDDVIKYVDSLEWYDYDWFCDGFSNLLLGFEVIKEQIWI